MTMIFECALERKAELVDAALPWCPTLRIVCREIRPAIGNTGFDIGIGVTHEQG